LLSVMRLLSVSVCSAGGRGGIAGLSLYVTRLRGNVLNKNQTDAFKSYDAAEEVRYTAQDFRSPFKRKRQVTSRRHSANPLERYSLERLHFVGIVSYGGKDSAILRTPDDKVYNVAIGGRIGQHKGKVVRISKDHISVVEKSTDGLGKVSDRTVNLRRRRT